MSKLRRQLSASTTNVVEPKNLLDLKEKTGNIYQSISVISKRANQINVTIKSTNSACARVLMQFLLSTFKNIF